MKKVVLLVAAALLTGATPTLAPLGVYPTLYANTAHSGSQIQWETDYQKALSIANERSLPLVLFFTGSDWCGWCKKLEEEVLDTPSFAKVAGEKYVFVMLDFPQRTPISPELKKQNASLRDRYKIKGYPTLVVIDGKENVLAQTGYQQGGPDNYSSHLAQLTKGKDVQFNAPLEVMAEVAVVDQEALKDKYRQLVAEGKIDSSEAQEVRESLLAADHGRQMHYDVALMEFEALASAMERGLKAPGQAVGPLVDYLDRFGHLDSENGWRIEMTVAQVYFEQKQYSDALAFAKKAHSHAPQDQKGSIEEVITSIEESQKETSPTA